MTNAQSTMEGFFVSPIAQFHVKKFIAVPKSVPSHCRSFPKNISHLAEGRVR